MERYVVHKGVYCQVFEHGWRVKQWLSPETGQHELMAWKRKLYVPMGDWDDPELIPEHVDQSGTLLEKEREEKARQQALAKSAARAKRTCRHKIKTAGFSSLLTCTYRENMKDFDRVRTDWAAMLRKLKRIIPGFSAVYAFETQDRGAWHVHAAIDKLPTHFEIPGEGRVRSWDYLRRCWHAIVGKGNGNIDLDGHRRNRWGAPCRSMGEERGDRRQRESLAKLAGYVSKYLTKDYAEGMEGRNRWGSTQGIKVAKAVVFDMPEVPFAQLIDLAFHVPEGHVISRHMVGRFGHVWVLFTEPDREKPPARA